MSGFRIQNGIAGMATAFSATWGAGKPVIGFLGEFDALPNLSQQAGSPIRKALVSGGPGHGCGHNLLGTSCAVAARATANAMKEHGFKGTVIFFGTPAEETLVGKVYMNRDGVFDAVDVMITWHPHDETGITCDSSLAMDNMKFRFHGKAAHAGLAPEQGRSALDAVELMNIGINFMREHLIQDARVHYVISRGGEVPNIVPAFAESWYFLRAPRRSDLDDIRRRMIDAAQGAALMTGTGMEWQLLTAVYERLPNSVLVRMGDKIVKQIGAPAFTEEDQRIGAAMVDGQGGAMHPQPFSTGIRSPDLHRVFPDVGHMKASGDFNYTWKIPSLSFDVAVVTKGTPLHSWQAVAQANSRPAQKAGIAACKYMAAAALECLADPQLVLEARLELNVNAAKFGYAEPIPPDLPVPTFKELYGFDPDNDTVSAVEPSAPKQ
jgi:aminobenzoyl-glutamate utilization protein B